MINQRMLGYNTPRERIQITSDRPDAITIDSYSLSYPSDTPIPSRTKLGTAVVYTT